MRKAHGHVLKSKRFSRLWASHPRVAFRDTKSLKDCLVRSKLKLESSIATGNLKRCSKRCKICKILVPGDEYKSFMTKKKYKINFWFVYNCIDVIYLISCTVCGSQYTGTTVARFRERFNHYKSNVNLYSQRVRGLMQEKMTSHFFLFWTHIGSNDDMYVKIIDQCDPNDKEKRKSLYIETLQTMYQCAFDFK